MIVFGISLRWVPSCLKYILRTLVLHLNLFYVSLSFRNVMSLGMSARTEEIMLTEEEKKERKKNFCCRTRSLENGIYLSFYSLLSLSHNKEFLMEGKIRQSSIERTFGASFRLFYFCHFFSGKKIIWFVWSSHWDKLWNEVDVFRWCYYYYYFEIVIQSSFKLLPAFKNYTCLRW